jgi:two-component system sensor histidine kinase KdpD
MQRFLGGRIVGLTVSVAMVIAVTYIYYRILHVNHTTVALSFLLAILAVSAVWGMAVSVVMSILAMLSLNYFFLPPV